jgi:hypothetical protein
MPIALWAHYPNLLGMMNKGNPASWNTFFAVTLAVLLNLGIGYKYPFQAIKGALYAGTAWRLIFAVRLLPLLSGHGWPGFAGDALLWTALDCALAYLASVTRRGWYRPRLADFKLSPARRRHEPKAWRDPSQRV